MSKKQLLGKYGRIVFLLIIIFLWFFWARNIISRIQLWLEEKQEVVVLNTKVSQNPEMEYPIYVRQRASQTFHFDSSQTIEKIFIPIVNPADKPVKLELMLKKDDMETVQESVMEIKSGSSEIELVPGNDFNPVRDLRIILSAPDVLEPRRAPRVYRESTSNIAVKIVSSSKRKDLLRIREVEPKDYVARLKWGVLWGLVMLFPSVLLSFFWNGKDGGEANESAKKG